MGREDHRRIRIGNLVEFPDEDRTFPLQVLDDVSVVDDLVPHIDGRTMDRERLLDRIDGPDHPGAKAAGCTEQDIERRLRHDRCDVAKRAARCQAGGGVCSRRRTRKGRSRATELTGAIARASGSGTRGPQAALNTSSCPDPHDLAPSGDDAEARRSVRERRGSICLILGPKGAPLALAPKPLY